MSCSTLLPLTPGERYALFQLMSELTNDEWLLIQVWMKNIIEFTPDCRDSFREAICNAGQAIFQYIVTKLQTDCDKCIDILKSSTTMYRYVWLEIDTNQIRVQSKGSLWYNTRQDCLSKGFIYSPSYDLPDCDWQPQFILSLEMQCLCQHLPCPLTDDIYARPQCRCIAQDENYHHLFTSPPIEAGIPTPNRICRLLATKKYINVVRLPWPIITPSKICLYIFCIVRSDTYFYSRFKDINRAFNEYVLNM